MSTRAAGQSSGATSCVAFERMSFFLDPMAALPIVRYPDARLRQKSQEFVSFDDDLRKLVTDMADTMFAAEGAGLAAIQVGVPLRLFLIDAGVAGRAETDSQLVFINPE